MKDKGRKDWAKEQGRGRRVTKQIVTSRGKRVTAAETESRDRDTQSEQQVGAQHESECVNTHSLHQTDMETALQHNKHFLLTHCLYKAA